MNKHRTGEQKPQPKKTVLVAHNPVSPRQTTPEWKHSIYAVTGGFLLGIVTCVILFQGFATGIFGGISDINQNISPSEYFFSAQPQQYLVIDVRSSQSFAREHLRKSISVPVQLQDGKIQDEEKVFRAIGAAPKDKTLILLGENSFSRVSEVLLSKLQTRGYTHVKRMNAGWNEIRHLATFWLPEDKWNTFQIETYLISSE